MEICFIFDVIEQAARGTRKRAETFSLARINEIYILLMEYLNLEFMTMGVNLKYKLELAITALTPLSYAIS